MLMSPRLAYSVAAPRARNGGRGAAACAAAVALRAPSRLGSGELWRPLGLVEGGRERLGAVGSILSFGLLMQCRATRCRGAPASCRMCWSRYVCAGHSCYLSYGRLYSI
ncbi:hypothetical protein TSOC_006703 [Tetrabaena socialis]|uniref:Uncharacterized protein n=1 Tax=Tetrabaena socialis TaxID=47790 RepID=A0A2J8A2Z4_9CHLO|nr:hypothetical protein TSOC_006703 [Tetrabaena socialis]|eukprot:PNH06891.1 hypothetical protein TSOC_006703 [Tetrabaena socialis]